MSEIPCPSPPKRRSKRDGIGCKPTNLDTTLTINSRCPPDIRQGWGRLSWIDPSLPSAKRWCDSCKRHSSSCENHKEEAPEPGDILKKGSLISLHRIILEGKKKRKDSSDITDENFSKLQKSSSSIDIRKESLTNSFKKRAFQLGKVSQPLPVDTPPALPSKNSVNKAFQPERPVKFNRSQSEGISSLTKLKSFNRSNYRVPPRPPENYPPPFPEKLTFSRCNTQPELEANPVQSSKLVISNGHDDTDDKLNAVVTSTDRKSADDLVLTRSKKKNKLSSQLKRVSLIKISSKSCKKTNENCDKDSNIRSRFTNSLRNRLSKRRKRSVDTDCFQTNSDKSFADFKSHFGNSLEPEPKENSDEIRSVGKKRQFRRSKSCSDNKCSNENHYIPSSVNGHSVSSRKSSSVSINSDCEYEALNASESVRSSENSSLELKTPTEEGTMSHHHPGTANYGTLKRGLKATTSRLIGASIRKPGGGMSPAISLDRSMGYGSTEPSRFVDGVSFKGKLIGVLEVEAARGDRMCQEALVELKGAVRAAGEHKQRIAVTVAMDGIRLRDDRTGDCLYHHPVHKISFIAQDMTDARAFGYIFGSPDAGHKFFGIKTEKTASQVVIAMRDLFQVVFEMKKKEIEKARSQLEEGRDGSDFKDSSGLFASLDGTGGFISASLTCGAGGAIADLLDLQSELSNLQRGLQQISSRGQQQTIDDKPFDPFGDSFHPVNVSTSGGKSGSSSKGSGGVTVPPPLAPPPLSGRSRHDSTRCSTSSSHHSHLHHDSSARSSTRSADVDHHHMVEFSKFPVDFNNMSSRAGAQSVPPHEAREDRYAVFKEIRPASDESLNDFGGDQPAETQPTTSTTLQSRLVHSQETLEVGGRGWGSSFERAEGWAGSADSTEGRSGSNYDVFTDLDPLGTGKIRPFIDKKDFFNEVRQKKRVLRELGDGEDSNPNSPRSQPNTLSSGGVVPTEVSALVASSAMYSTNSQNTYNSSEALQTSYEGGTSTTRVHTGGIASHHYSDSPPPPTAETLRYEGTQGGASGFADFNRFSGESPRSQRSDMSSSLGDDLPSSSIPQLTVALPPESFRDSPPDFSPKKVGKQMAGAEGVSPNTLPRAQKVSKQASVDGDWDPPCDASINSGEGSSSARPRPRGNLSKNHSVSSATLPNNASIMTTGTDRFYTQRYVVNQSKFYEKQNKMFEKKFDPDEPFSSPEGDFQPFPKVEDLVEGDPNHSPAPAPPPRPAAIQPPPLPPKRQPTHVTMRPPPLPPCPSSMGGGVYIYSDEKRDLQSYPSLPPASSSSSPPLPLPSRRPRYSEVPHPSIVPPNRAQKPLLAPVGASVDQMALQGAIPKLGPLHSSHESSKNSTPVGRSPRSGLSSRRRPSTCSIDLANTSLDQLASKLEIPVEDLAKMTVVELAACLAQIQLKQGASFGEDSIGEYIDTDTLGGAKQSRDPSEDRSRDDDFASFDAQFPVSPSNTPDFTLSAEGKASLGAPVSEDRYAVFRELSGKSEAAPPPTRLTVGQKSVFDENFLTPQNSMEDEISDYSSGAFKSNFLPDEFRQDSMDQKSSLSDDLDHDRVKNWNNNNSNNQPVSEGEGLTVFRSPDISEYENFEPENEPFDEGFVFHPQDPNIPQHLIRLPSPVNTAKLSVSSAGKSPFTDDFSCASQEEVAKKLDETKSGPSSGKFDDDFIPPVDKYAVFRELAALEDTERTSTSSERALERASTSSATKYPFEDNFGEQTFSKDSRSVLDSGFLSDNKYDDVFHEDIKQCSDEGEMTEEPSVSKITVKESDSINNLQHDDSESLNKSPFEDDFNSRSDKYEMLKEVESEREPSIDGETICQESKDWCESDKNVSFDDSSRNEINSKNSSPKIRSSFRDSPYDDIVKPATPRILSKRRLDSEGSYNKEILSNRSPFDDNFGGDNFPEVPSVDVNFESAFPSLQPMQLNFESDENCATVNGNDDPFDNIRLGAISDEASGSEFADFDNAFQQEKSKKERIVLPRTPNPSFDDVLDEPVTPNADTTTKEITEFKVSAGFGVGVSKGQDPHDIFRRNSDPFADEFFTDSMMVIEGEDGTVQHLNSQEKRKPETNHFTPDNFSNEYSYEK